MTIFEQSSPASWLLTVPIGDCNARSALKNATLDELNAVLAELHEQVNKTKIKAIQDEIKRIERK